MTRARLITMRVVSLLLLLPGIAGLILSAAISTHYLNTLPTSPAPEQLRMTPRTIDGRVVYQTEEEARRLTTIEYASIVLFAAGAVLGVIYLEKWSAMRTDGLEGEELISDSVNR